MISLPLQLIVIAFLGICVAFSIFSFWKIRKIHLISFELLTNTKNLYDEIKSLFQQIQALLALDRKLNLKEALPPMRGWAGSPDFLLKVAEEAMRRKPRIVMECSSGASTVVVARCLQLNGSGHVYSLENSPEYAMKTRDLLEQHKLSSWATVLNAPLVTKKTQTPWYDESVIPAEVVAIDMLIVDGPPASTAPLARYPALPQLYSRMATNCIVLLDDADRKDEIELLRRWEREFTDFEKTYFSCEKGLAQLIR